MTCSRCTSAHAHVRTSVHKRVQPARLVLHLSVEVGLEEKRDAVALAPQLVYDPVHRRPQAVVGPMVQSETWMDWNVG